MFNLFKNSNEIKGSRNEPMPLTHSGLPDSYRPNGLCPRCRKQSSFEEIGNLPVTFDGGISNRASGNQTPTYSDRVTVLLCRHCNQGIVVIEEEWVGEQPKRLGMSEGVVSHRGVVWWPLPENNLSTDIPEDISSIYGEATTAFYASAYRASAIMLRSTLEAITVYFGETTGALAKRLEHLREQNVLLPVLFDWSKEVRLLGNQSTHNPADLISKDDAKQLLDFIRELMKYLFEMPAELKRKRNQ